MWEIRIIISDVQKKLQKWTKQNSKIHFFSSKICRLIIIKEMFLVGLW